MSTEIPVTPPPGATPPAPAAVTPPAVAPPAGDPPPAVTPPVTPPAETPPAYKVPDAYKDKPWAAKIKTEDDVYKTIDNLNTAVGKKTVIPDFKTADAKEIEDYFNSMRPETAESYAFGEEGDPEFNKDVQKVLFDAGIADPQAKKLIPAYQALEKAAIQKATSAEGFAQVMKDNFGEKYDALVVQAQQDFKTHLNDGQKKILDVMPNQYLAPLYQIVAAKNAEIAALRKEYGVTEKGDAHLSKGSAPAAPDITKVRADLRKQISDLEARPYTADEKQKLVDQLDQTYRNK